MISTSDNAESVLYHAVSSYQLLEVMLHRLIVHSCERAVLLLPDFITEKYPQYKKLGRFFDRVCLFPYLHIPHGTEERILADTPRHVQALFPAGLSAFSRIYTAGAHFYFSLYLIQNRLPFVFFEDAAGMLSRADELFQTLSAKFPIHAEIAEKYGLFDASQPLIRRIICLKRIQTRDVSGDRYQDFSVEDALLTLPDRQRNALIRFFLRHRIRTDAEAILLTQQFAGLGLLRREEQIRLYENLRDGVLRGVRLIIKKHPDDPLSYASVFPGVTVIKEIFPAELLPFVFRNKPEIVYTWDSTGCENLRKHFQIRKLGGETHAEKIGAAGGEFGLSAFDGRSSQTKFSDGLRNGAGFDR